jgi:glycosyltransferase involved in cell wall biosynthesis
MIRVLHVINWFELGGVETQLLYILREYDRTRFHMDVCTIGGHAGQLAEEASRTGAEILSCPKSPNLFSFSHRFASQIKGKRYHIVHSAFEAWSGPILRAAHNARVPVRIAQLHAMQPWPTEHGDSLSLKGARAAVSLWGRYWLCRHATHVIAVSKAVMEARLPSCVRTRPELALWTGGVDTTRFAPTDAEGPGRSEFPIILWVGALRRPKRIDIQFRVLSSVLKAIPETKLFLVGGGVQHSALRELAERMKIADSVRFLGPRDDVPELIRSADVFLSCSETEGLPTVLLEAQASAIPVVATDIPPHREALSPVLHPYLFGLDQPEAGAKAIVRILTDAKLRASLGKQARQFILERYGASVQLRRLENHYECWAESCQGKECCR